MSAGVEMVCIGAGGVIIGSRCIWTGGVWPGVYCEDGWIGSYCGGRLCGAG